MMLTELYYYYANHPAAKAPGRAIFNCSPASTKAACTAGVSATFNSVHDHETAHSLEWLLDSQSRNGLAGKPKIQPFFPLPAHPFCLTPEPDGLIDTLKRVLQRAATDSGTLCRRISGKSFAVIGTHFNRDHASVVHACQLIERRIARDAALRWFIEQLELRLTGAAPSPPQRQTHEV